VNTREVLYYGFIKASKSISARVRSALDPLRARANEFDVVTSHTGKLGLLPSAGQEIMAYG